MRKTIYALATMLLSLTQASLIAPAMAHDKCILRGGALDGRGNDCTQGANWTQDPKDVRGVVMCHVYSRSGIGSVGGSAAMLMAMDKQPGTGYPRIKRVSYQIHFNSQMRKNVKPDMRIEWVQNEKTGLTQDLTIPFDKLQFRSMPDDKEYRFADLKDFFKDGIPPIKKIAIGGREQEQFAMNAFMDINIYAPNVERGQNDPIIVQIDPNTKAPSDKNLLRNLEGQIR